MADGILVINKPQGLTSHDVVVFVRRKLKIRKVGHAGTLDPQATGVLVLLLGACTKFFETFLGFDKEYVATVTLGKKTSTADLSGKVLAQKDYSHVTLAMVQEVLSGYRGPIQQTPPMVSAVKYKGKRLYALARQGKSVPRVARTVVIRDLALLDFSPPHIRVYLKCSRGTYVRQLAEDIAEDLGCVGCVSEIQRLSIGPYHVSNSLCLEEVSPEKILPFKA